MRNDNPAQNQNQIYDQAPNNYNQQPQGMPQGMPSQGYYSESAPPIPPDQYYQNQNGQSYNQPPMNGHSFQQPSNGYLLSRVISSKRKALFIGINYFKTKSELRGCIADVKNVHDWLIANYGFHEICILTDDSNDPRGQPTRQNMINGMKWLVRDACPGDSFFFHYSGHGSRVKDQGAFSYC